MWFLWPTRVCPLFLWSAPPESVPVNVHDRFSRFCIVCVGGSSPSCLEGPSFLFWVRGEGRKAKVRGPMGQERGRGSCKWQPAPPHQLRVCGCALSFPGGIRGGAPAAKRFSCILEAPHDVYWNLLGPSSRGAWPPASPLNPPMIVHQCAQHAHRQIYAMCDMC